MSSDRSSACPSPPISRPAADAATMRTAAMADSSRAARRPVLSPAPRPARRPAPLVFAAWEVRNASVLIAITPHVLQGRISHPACVRDGGVKQGPESFGQRSYVP